MVKQNLGTIASLTDSSGGTADGTVQALTDPTDTPTSADALRDNLVATTLPEIRNNFAEMATKLNEILAAMKATGMVTQ